MTSTPPKLTRLPAALILGVLAEALFLFRLAVPHKLVFDETHYVPAARTLLALAQPTNIEHPLLGKTLIAAGIALFGDNSFGWRFFSTLAATAVVLGIFWIMQLLYGRTRPAVFAALFTILNITVFVQARIAMLDGFMAAFVVTGIAALLWSMRAPPRWVVPRLVLGAVLLGLGIGAKWAALPYIGYAGLAFLLVRVRDAQVAGCDLESALYGSRQPHWAGLGTLPALLILGCVSIAVYLLTFLPAFFYAQDPLTLVQLIPYQAKMFHEQTQVLPHHTYQSSWWSWPLDIRPIWYLYEPVDGAERGILMIGNPAVMWGGLIAVLACLYGAWRDHSIRLLAVAGLWIGAYAMWAIIPKSLGFFYYYYLPSLFLGPALAAAFDHYGKGRFKHWDEYFTVLAFGLFVYFYPIIAANALPDSQAFQHWMWFPSWP